MSTFESIVKARYTEDRQHILRIVRIEQYCQVGRFPDSTFNVELLGPGGVMVGQTANLSHYADALDAYYCIMESAVKYNNLKFVTI